MNLLRAGKAKEAKGFFDQAAKMAIQSTCLRAHCGSVIVKDREVIGVGYNSPPLDEEENRTCELEFSSGGPKQKYDRTCCIHAEWRAILDGLKRNADKMSGSRLYFMRLGPKEEKSLADELYCTTCSRLVLEAGIAEFALLRAEGPTVYSAEEFNRLSYGFLSESK